MITATHSTQKAAPPPADDRWRAVLSRDVGADGTFVYAVTSTGVYCRPSCPSRRPRADRVRFYDTPAAASRAGFRPCRRCRPDAARSPLVARVERARAWIDTHPDETPRLARLAAIAGTSAWHLQRSFRRLFGVSPREYAAARRGARLKAGLRSAEPLTGVMYDAGYSSPSRLYEEVSGVLGMSPGAYRRGGAGQQVLYAVAATRLGPVLAAVGSRGICHVAFGESAPALEQDLAGEFPNADLVRDDETMRPVLRAVTAAADGGAPAPLPLPLDLRGTAFQRRVWRALVRIPSGETRTYGQLAAELGQPSAARAVAAACAANRLALLVPCHRVVPAAGGAGGYRWGAKRKARLQASERAGRRRS